MTPSFTVTRKVAIGYLILTLFSLLAVGYALISLHDHDRHTEQLVGGQFRAFTLLRDVRQNLIAQESLEKQLLILRDKQLMVLLNRRNEDLQKSLVEVASSPLPGYVTALPTTISQYLAEARHLEQVFVDADWDKAEELARDTTAPLRKQLLEDLADLRAQHQTTLDKELSTLSRQSGRAYRMTLLITLIGILLSAPAAITVMVSIHRSVRVLQKATHDIAAGSFDSEIDIRSNDEFGQLARDFARMSRKLEEFERHNLDANPLTRLPGNLVIDRTLEERIEQQQPFAHLYIDLDNFKAYGDHYGYKKGSDVLEMVGNLLQEVVTREGQKEDLIGHIGGDDYVILTSPERAEPIARAIISAFDDRVPELYTAEDFATGYVRGIDRYGEKRTFPLLTMSIAVTLSENLDHPSVLAISNNCAKMKEHLKRLKNSNYLIDRRKQIS